MSRTAGPIAKEKEADIFSAIPEPDDVVRRMLVLHFRSDCFNKNTFHCHVIGQFHYHLLLFDHGKKGPSNTFGAVYSSVYYNVRRKEKFSFPSNYICKSRAVFKNVVTVEGKLNIFLPGAGIIQ